MSDITLEFQSRNRESFDFSLREGGTGSPLICFNLVIESLLISVQTYNPPMISDNRLFQSRNRESFDFRPESQAPSI